MNREWTFDNLPKYENGQDIEYTITEDEVDDPNGPEEQEGPDNSDDPDDSGDIDNSEDSDKTSDDGKKEENPNMPMTNDGSNIELYTLMMAVSLAGAIIAIRKQRQI